MSADRTVTATVVRAWNLRGIRPNPAEQSEAKARRQPNAGALHQEKCRKKWVWRKPHGRYAHADPHAPAMPSQTAERDAGAGEVKSDWMAGAVAPTLFRRADRLGCGASAVSSVAEAERRDALPPLAGELAGF
jgi:hypothetical protein